MPCASVERAELQDVVADVVRAAEPIEEEPIRSRVTRLVDRTDVPAVLAMALNELHGLHKATSRAFGSEGASSHAGPKA